MRSVENGLKKAYELHNHRPRIQYSMNWNYRQGPDKGYNYLDCSSFVSYYLRAAGVNLSITYGSTETLFKEKGLEEVYDYKNVRRGDIFIRGGEGTSAGAGGHTGIFLGGGKIIHCNYGHNGITIDGTWEYLDRYRHRRERYFRIKNSNSEKAPQRAPQKTPSSSNSKNKVKFIKNEKWTGKTLTSCNVRSYPSTNASVVAVYGPNQYIHYDSVYEGNGYRWISYIGNSGKRRYVAYRNLRGGKPWIIF